MTCAQQYVRSIPGLVTKQLLFRERSGFFISVLLYLLIDEKVLISKRNTVCFPVKPNYLTTRLYIRPVHIYFCTEIKYSTAYY